MKRKLQIFIFQINKKVFCSSFKVFFFLSENIEVLKCYFSATIRNAEHAKSLSVSWRLYGARLEVCKCNRRIKWNARKREQCSLIIPMVCKKCEGNRKDSEKNGVQKEYLLKSRTIIK